MNQMHSFHIPVLGIGYSADTPLKIAQYGMDSVLSLVDDILLEKLRNMYCGQHGLAYSEISDKTDDYRARRITAYLDLLHFLSEKKFNDLKSAACDDPKELHEFFSMLPEESTLEDEFHALVASGTDKVTIQNWLDKNLSMGSIDVNIMTKIDRDNYRKGEKLPV